MPWLRIAAKVDWDQVAAIAEQVRGGAMEGQFSEEPTTDEFMESGTFYDARLYPEQPDLDNGSCHQITDLFLDKLYEATGILGESVTGIFHVAPGIGPASVVLDNDGNSMQHEGFEHTWAMVNGGIVDLSADQFNGVLARAGKPLMPKVFMSRGSDPRYESCTPLEGR